TGLPNGDYDIAVSKGGYQTSASSSIAVSSSTPVTLAIVLHVASFSSLRTIAAVKSKRDSPFNTSTASVNVVTAQAFVQQGAMQVAPVLDEIPGVQISYPGSSANGAAPGAITFPNIRDGLSYETATLIDGHPLSVGLYGDYVSTFLNPYLLQSAEVIKGPGAMAPQVNYAINGTVNFRTKDPTADPQTFYLAGGTNRNGGEYALGVSDTILNGRLGFVFGAAGLWDPSAVHNIPVYFDPGSGSGFLNGVNLYPYGCGQLNPLQNTNAKQFYSRAYNTCSLLGSATVSAPYLNDSELFKLKYKISDRTNVTVSYLGSQSWANQSGNTSAVLPSTFTPGTGYHGALAPGSGVDVLTEPYDAQPEFEENNEPIFQAELSTAVGNDTLLARYYHATIDRNQFTSYNNPFFPYQQSTNLYGTLEGYSSTSIFNGDAQNVEQYNYFNEPEIDKVAGYSLEYTHPFGENDELSFAADTTHSTSVNYYQDVEYAGNQCQYGDYQGSCLNTQTSIPSGAYQNFTTLNLRDRMQFGQRLAATISLYDNIYTSNYPTNCLNATNYVGNTAYKTTCLPNGTLDTWKATNPYSFVSNVPVSFQSGTTGHFDERVGLEWRPQSQVAVRFSAGSSIAPPFLALLSEANQITPPSHAGPGSFATQTLNSGTLHPETAFGYDIGGDYAFHDGVTFASTDLYLTNLFGQFLTQTYLNGTCPVAVCGVPGVPLYTTQNVNLSNARYEGIEATIERLPPSGWGFSLTGSTQRGYAYNLPSNFYCGTPTCIAGEPSTYNKNLGIIAGQNYIGEFVNSTGSTSEGVSNQAVPYLQGDAQLNYRFKNGIFMLFGDTLYGKNNSLNEPPFGVAYASVSLPIHGGLAFQASGYNLFNTYSQLFPTFGGGITVPLANGQAGGTIGNVLGPARFVFVLTNMLGPTPDQVLPAPPNQPPGVNGH
ncbi:MAG TPA: TonB-dependent receptor plug domain-containing protein, partial [Candidatus Tumulicola sp.]